MDTLERIKRGKVIAIVRGLPVDAMLSLAGALNAGGIDMMEVTFDQAKPDAWRETAKAIENVREHFGDTMLIGAGTVIKLMQLELAYQAGAKYCISPNVDERIIRRTKELGLISIPGAMTATECVQAKDFGADIVKIFPAGTLGAGYIRALKAPLSHIDMIAVGGINEDNAGAFMRAGAVGVGVGGDLVKKEHLLSGRFDVITNIARALRKAVDE